ncbi:cytochrome protein [Sphaerosporella brunnea]|uniref:Cytochrome protein n=1 Tax=Sphaerosporella brunnea TaxID=1250544 RepID=A0A5J5ESA6_9PEZI|nr:cytochrome protein [Sphaerosporella brunnea]
MALPIVFAVAALVVYLVLKVSNRTISPKIPGLPAVPGLPFVGSLFDIGSCHSRKAQEWAQTYGPVFQVRLGNRWIVFANTYDAIQELWIKQQSALISRPTLYTFHKVVSSSQGFTIGTSPWDESCKRRRKAAATALNRPAVESYMPIVDLESSASIRELLVDSQYGEKEINPAPYFHRFALNTSLTLNYGYRIKGNVDDAQLREIVDVERAVSNLRSTSNNWQDYVPALRLLSGRNQEAVEMRKRRDKYMIDLLNELQRRIKEGTDRPCITGNILKDPEAKLNEAEIRSICLTMVSAGLDTVPGNLVMGLGYLSTPQGQEIQKKCYDAIMQVYPNGEAWDACLREEKVPYVMALVKEVLRFWCVVPISLPRVNIKDVVYKGVTIPAGTTFFMVSLGN